MMSVKNYAQLKKAFLLLGKSEVRFKTPMLSGKTTIVGLKMNKLLLAQIELDESVYSISRVEDEEYYIALYKAIMESI